MSDFISVQDMLENAPYGAQKNVTAEIRELELAIKKRMDAGLSAEEMAPARKAYAALQAATELLNKLFA